MGANPTLAKLALAKTMLFVDLFCGGGGVSTGFEMAMGRSPDLAINHCPAAVAMHEANHPNTRGRSHPSQLHRETRCASAAHLERQAREPQARRCRAGVLVG